MKNIYEKKNLLGLFCLTIFLSLILVTPVQAGDPWDSYCVSEACRFPGLNTGSQTYTKPVTVGNIVGGFINWLTKGLQDKAYKKLPSFAPPPFNKALHQMFADIDQDLGIFDHIETAMQTNMEGFAILTIPELRDSIRANAIAFSVQEAIQVQIDPGIANEPPLLEEDDSSDNSSSSRQGNKTGGWRDENFDDVPEYKKQSQTFWTKRKLKPKASETSEDEEEGDAGDSDDEGKEEDDDDKEICHGCDDGLDETGSGGKTTFSDHYKQYIDAGFVTVTFVEVDKIQNTLANTDYVFGIYDIQNGILYLNSGLLNSLL